MVGSTLGTGAKSSTSYDGLGQVAAVLPARSHFSVTKKVVVTAKIVKWSKMGIDRRCWRRQLASAARHRAGRPHHHRHR
jgi:hypothetical protein